MIRKRCIPLILLSVLLLPVCARSQTPDSLKYLPAAQNLAAREEFSKSRLGIFLHWGIYSMLGDGEWVMNIRNHNYTASRRLFNV